MYCALRKTLVLLMTVALTFGPSLHAIAGDCGCSPVYSVPVSDCGGCSSCYVDCCSTASCCGAEVVVQQDSCGCGTAEPVAVQEESCGCSGTTSVVENEHMHTEVSKPTVADEPEVQEPVTPPPVTPQPALEPEEALTDPQPVSSPEPAVETTPVEEEPADFLLDEPEPTPDVEPAVVEPAEPVADPAPAEPADDFDSMFEEPEQPAATPAESAEEAAEEPEESLFDDMFGEPEETPAPFEETESSPIEPAEEPAEEPMEEPAEDDSEEDFDDLFGSDSIPAELRVAGGLHSSQSRHWTDNTARYHCQARLVSVEPSEVVLEKSDGSMKRVSLRRLSQRDLRFVQLQAVAQQQMLAKQGETKNLVSQISK